MNLQKDLNRILQKVKEKYPNVNNGGCAFFAVALGKELENRNIPFWFLVDDPWINTKYYHKPIQRIKPNHYTKYNLTAFHVWISVNGYEVNALEGHEYRNGRRIPVERMYDFMNNIMDGLRIFDDIWNPAFGADNVMPMCRYVKNLCKIYLS